MLSLFLCVYVSLPLSLHSAPVEGILSSIVRQPGIPDTVFPTVCPPACQDLFHAQDGLYNETLGDSCSCICPPERPVYLNTAGFCVKKLDECRHNIAFDVPDSMDKYLPVISLPAHNGVVLPKTPILWQDAGVSSSSSGAVNCSITGVFFDNIRHRWRATEKKSLFRLLTAGGQTVIIFRGSDIDASVLRGAVVQMKVSCAGFLPDEHCISFRVTGISGANPYLSSGSSGFPEKGFVLLVILLIFFTIFVIFFVWQLCWRRKKKRLITDIQMQFLYHFKQQQEAQKAAAAHLAATSSNPITSSEFYPQPERSSLNQKRRLFFSAEYLDPELMHNPPPVADQFLFDLRRMIEMSRDRIRLRRFVPELITIPEITEEHRPASLVVTPEEEGGEESQESPRSESKSVDSGRESREDSDEDDDDENKKTVRSLVSGFESRIPPPSQIPLPSRSSEKPPAKPVRAPSSQIPTLIGQASPRPVPRGLTIPASPALPQTPPPGTANNKSYKARKGYSVFPANPMLNKSLPRRPKRTSLPTRTAEVD